MEARHTRDPKALPMPTVATGSRPVSAREHAGVRQLYFCVLAPGLAERVPMANWNTIFPLSRVDN